MRDNTRTIACVATLVLVCLTGCGGGSKPSPLPPPPPSQVSVSLSPASVNLLLGSSQQFTALVSGTSNAAVIWGVSEGPRGGTISETGLFTSAITPGIYHVIAISAADGSKSATATVFVGTTAAITIIPSPYLLGPGGLYIFGVVPDTPVTWTVVEGPAGGIVGANEAPRGIILPNPNTYTAPLALGTYHLMATSIADPSKTSTATITVVKSGFTLVGSMAHERAAHTATLLADGSVLVVAGGTFDIDDLLVPISGAEVFNSSLNHFDVSVPTLVSREFHTATLLQNGKVLVVGGSDTDTSAELYDPALGSFAKTGSMAVARAGHTATLLADGRVLVVGGSSDLRAEIYDPATGTFATTGSLSSARLGHSATILPNGEILVVGGQNSSGQGIMPTYLAQSIVTTKVLASTEIYDPQSATFSPSGSMSSSRTGHTATLLGDGTVLVAGGANSSGANSTPLASTEIYNPFTGQFESGADMAVPRTNHTATVLADGTVLMVGGIPAVPPVYVGYGPNSTAEIYDPSSASFSQAVSMSDGRFWHSATLLRDGRVLIVGGGHSDAPFFGADSVATAETRP